MPSSISGYSICAGGPNEGWDGASHRRRQGRYRGQSAAAAGRIKGPVGGSGTWGQPQPQEACLEQEGPGPQVGVKLLGHPVPRPPDLDRLLHRHAALRRRRGLLLRRLVRRSLGHVLLVPLALGVRQVVAFIGVQRVAQPALNLRPGAGRGEGVGTDGPGPSIAPATHRRLSAERLRTISPRTVRRAPSATPRSRRAPRRGSAHTNRTPHLTQVIPEKVGVLGQVNGLQRQAPQALPPVHCLRSEVMGESVAGDWMRHHQCVPGL